MLNLRQFGGLLNRNKGAAESDMEPDPSFWDQRHEVRNIYGTERRVRTVPGGESSPQLPGMESH
jgi:hypothetical protein